MTTLAGTAILQGTGLSKTYGQARVLDDVSLDIRSGEVHALLGGNGSGKSTLIKGLAGVIPLDGHGGIDAGHGPIAAGTWSPHHARAAKLRFVHQDLGLFSELSIVENLALGSGFVRTRWGRVRWKTARDRAQLLLDRYGIAARPQTKVGSLSLAQAAMLAVGRALQDVGETDNAVIFLDEPTGALPAAEASALHEALRKLVRKGHAVVLVTHDIEEALTRSDRVTVLRDGVRTHSGPTADLDRERLIELIVGRSRRSADRWAARSTPYRAEDPALEIEKMKGPGLDVTGIRLERGEIVGVTGLLNSGADLVLRAVFGLEPGIASEIRVGGRRLDASSPRRAMCQGVAYLPCDRLKDGAFRGLPVVENMSMASLRHAAPRGRIRHRGERREAAALTRAFRVRPEDPRRLIESLSGGNQQKVLLARWVRRNPSVLLLDDPTRGVDVGARADIWDLLRDEAERQGLAVLATSSDPEELATFCDRVLVLGHGRLHADLPGRDLTASAITSAAYAAADPQEHE